MKNVLLLFAILAANGLASADTEDLPGLSGNAFVRLCSAADKTTADMSTKEAFHSMACYGYVDGFIDGAAIGSA